MWDADGRRYLDYHAAFGAILLGHNDPEVNAAAARAVAEVDLMGIGVPEIAFAEKIVSVIPSADTVVACTSGSEATHHAIRLARGLTGRRRIVKVQGGFHARAWGRSSRTWGSRPGWRGSARSSCSTSSAARPAATGTC